MKSEESSNQENKISTNLKQQNLAVEGLKTQENCSQKNHNNCTEKQKSSFSKFLIFAISSLILGLEYVLTSLIGVNIELTILIEIFSVVIAVIVVFIVKKQSNKKLTEEEFLSIKNNIENTLNSTIKTKKNNKTK